MSLRSQVVIDGILNIVLHHFKNSSLHWQIFMSLSQRFEKNVTKYLISMVKKPTLIQLISKAHAESKHISLSEN